MIKITCLDGPWAGRTCKFKGVLMVELCYMADEGELTIPAREKTDPADLFASFLHHNWRWEADYSEATEEEKLEWFRAEIVVRIIRALERGLPVYFLGKEYRAREDIPEVAGRLEDDIVTSGMMITIASDDEDGLVIGSEKIQ